MSRFGILTGGGDAPALNAVIRAVVRRAVPHGHSVTGIRYGWKGLLDGDTVPLDLAAVSGILHRGGTILRTSRTNPYRTPDDERRLKEGLRSLGLDALIACGGEDTLGVANRLHAEGFPLVGVPKTIDNDLSGTDATFGFDTAVSIATEAIDRLHTTAESHDRVIVVEVMGRHAGWIAVHAGIAGGADAILVPEVPGSIDRIMRAIESRRARGKRFSIIVVAEGASLADDEGAAGGEPGEGAPRPKEKERTHPAISPGERAAAGAPVVKAAGSDAFGHVTLGGIGEEVAARIQSRTGLDTRTVVLGHTQRGGPPTARDRILGTLFGVMAADLAMRREFGTMASLRGERVVAVPIAEGVARLRTIDPDLYRIAETFFG